MIRYKEKIKHIVKNNHEIITMSVNNYLGNFYTYALNYGFTTAHHGTNKLF